MSEQRTAQRESTYKAARIGAGPRATLHCGVRNLSATGACLRIDDPAGRPPTASTSCSTAASRRACAA